MTTARELLEQADALMRRQREAPGDDVPLLTDVVGSTSVPQAPPPAAGDDELPVLTDEIEPSPGSAPEQPRPPHEAFLPAPKPLDEWIPGLPSADDVVLRPGPEARQSPTAAGAGRSPMHEAGPRAFDAPAAPEPSAADEALWRDLREQVYASVIQRVDLFTDGALRERLAEEVRPIVERAGEGLIERIGDELGRLIRAYVAEAVDREITAARVQSRAKLD